MARTRTLDVIEVEEPCTEDWDRMLGGGAVRFCRVCRFNVYDLSQMSLGEAARLVEESEGRLCVRFVRRADGTVVTDDCAPARFAALRKAARRSLRVAAAMSAALLAFLLGAVGALSMWLGRSGGPEPRLDKNVLVLATSPYEHPPFFPPEPAQPEIVQPAQPEVVQPMQPIEHEPRPVLMGRIRRR